MKAREEIIHSMCLTWDHRYSKDRYPNILFDMMARLFDHEIAPLLGMQPTPKGKVRVRIAVAVDEEGKWDASGYINWTDAEAKENTLVCDTLGEVIAVHFIEADLPIPSPTTLEGVVIQEKA